MVGCEANMTIDEYLEQLAAFADSKYGRMVRNQFKDRRGSAELAMLAAPTTEELEQLRRAVAIMTLAEKQNACNLTEQQIQHIAADAGIDAGNFAIFINGFALHRKQPQKHP